MAEERTATEALRLWVPLAAAAVGVVSRLARFLWGLVRRLDRLEAESVTDEALAPHLAEMRAELRQVPELRAQLRRLAEERASLEARLAALEAKSRRGRR